MTGTFRWAMVQRHWLILLLIIVLGAALRLNQYLDQVLTDDEWHAVHQVVLSTPGEFLFSFGHADYSIPLTWLYWGESWHFGLSELGMRWPMMLAGLATLLLFPWRVARSLDWRVALLFAVLLAISPLLINFSRMARPYALTLLLGYVAHWAFLGYLKPSARTTAYGWLYGVSATLASWLHLLALPFVVAPFLLAGVPALRQIRQDGGAAVQHLLRLGGPTALAMSVLLLPPLLLDTKALADKSGVHFPNLDTVTGVWHVWLGTPQVGAVVICLALAVAGASRVWRAEPLARSAMAGLALTLALVLASRPNWIQHPLTFGRYLLPMQPLLLLAVAAGALRLGDGLASRWSARARGLPVLVLLAALLAATPLRDTLSSPNGQTQHSVFQFDYRRLPDSVAGLMKSTIPLSPWWHTLRASPRDSLLIAVAPYQYLSYLWDAPRWEAKSRQRVIPGFLSGGCLGWRYGEVPRDERFALRNAVHLADPAAVRRRGVDFVVFQKPYHAVLGSIGLMAGGDVAFCLDDVRRRFGGAVYEDDNIAVFSMKTAPGGAEHAQ